MCFYMCLQNVGQNGHVHDYPAVSSGIPKNPGIPGFLKIKSRDFGIAQKTMFTKNLFTKNFVSNFCAAQILPFSKEFFMQISAVDLLANLMKEKTTSLILIVPYVCVQEAESHAYSYCNLKENISAKIFIF